MCINASLTATSSLTVPIAGLPYEKQFLSGAVANLERPDVVTEAHLDFIRAGAQVLLHYWMVNHHTPHAPQLQVITTNTFALTPWSLARIQRQHCLRQLIEVRPTHTTSMQHTSNQRVVHMQLASLKTHLRLRRRLLSVRCTMPTPTASLRAASHLSRNGAHDV